MLQDVGLTEIKECCFSKHRWKTRGYIKAVKQRALNTLARRYPETTQSDGLGDATLILFFESDPGLLSHEAHGCRVQAPQCRVLHPVKYAQLSDMLARQISCANTSNHAQICSNSLYGSYPCTHACAHWHREERSHSVFKHRQLDWLVLYPIPCQHNWITHLIPLSSIYIVHRHTFLTPCSGDFNSSCMNLPIQTADFYARSAVSGTLWLANGILFIYLFFYSWGSSHQARLEG